MEESKVELHTTKTMNIKRKHKKYSLFIKGPIQLMWITEACKLTKSAIKVALAICFLKGIYGDNIFKLENTIIKRFGIDRQGKSRGLRELEQAGLVEVVQNKGSLPLIKVVDSVKSK